MRKRVMLVLAGLAAFSVFSLGQQRARQTEESGNFLRRWLDQDVAYIITDEETTAFKGLQTDEEREQFIEQFWLRRDPTPDTVENEYRDDHYSRIALANERYAAGVSGWKTDRGRIYILHGEPDSIESRPAGGTYYRTFQEGGGSTSTYPFEIWRYRHIDGLGDEVMFEFVDQAFSGGYRLTVDPNDKDAFLNVPNAGLTDFELENGLDKSERFTQTDGAHLGSGLGIAQRKSQFDRLQDLANAFKPPEVKFKDLESIVTTRLSYNLLPFDLRVDFVKVTEESVLTPVTIQFNYRDLAFREEDGVHQAIVHIFGKITGINGRVAQVFEDAVASEAPAALFQQSLQKSGVYQKVIPIRPGLYKLDLVLKDVNSGNVGTISQRLAVPRFPEGQLGASSLILADRIEPLPPQQIASGPFIIGGTKVRPSVREEFTRSQELNVWLQVYGLKLDEATHKPSAKVELLVVRDGRTLKQMAEESTELSSAAEQMTITRKLPLADLDPGEYTIQLKVTDNLTRELIVSTGKFSVR